MGLENYIGLEMSESVNLPQPMGDDLMTSPIVEYDIGEMASIFRLEDSTVLWAGLKLAYAPEKFPLPEGTGVRSVGASDRGIAVVTGTIFFLNKR